MELPLEIAVNDRKTSCWEYLAVFLTGAIPENKYIKLMIHWENCSHSIIQCIDMAEDERIRTQGRPVSENLCVI